MMSEDFIDHKTVDHLIQDLEDGVITQEDRAKLMDLMREHASVRELYLKHVEMVALLQESAESRAELGTMPVSKEMVTAQRRRSAMVSFTYGIAALLLLSVGFLVFQVSQRSELDVRGVVMEHSEDASFSLVHADGEGHRSKKLQTGDRIQLDHGLVKLLFPSGVEAIVEGPSNLELTSDLSVKMDQGMAWFIVPEAGHGFTVQTDRVNVIDLGTEFGVRFDGGDGLQVHVARGKVRVEPVLKAMEKIELVQNEAMSFDVFGRGNVVDYKTSLFRKKFSRSMPYLHWSFDHLVEGGFEATGTMPGAKEYQAKLRYLDENIKLDTTKNFQTEGRHGKALSIDGSGLFAETAFPGIGGNAPRTVAGWVRHRKDVSSLNEHWGVTPYCAWGIHETGRVWKVFLWRGKNPRLCTSIVESARVTDVSRDNLSAWMHVTSVYTGKSDNNGFPEIRHYINGQLQVSNVIQEALVVETDVSSDKAKPVRFGASVVADAKTRTLDADLDEFYIFRGVLNEAQIKGLMETNRVDFSIK